MISKSLSTSRKFAAAGRSHLAEFPQLVYTMLIPHADDFGRQEGDPYTIRLKVLPASDRPESDFLDALKVLQDAGLIEWYETEAGQVVEIVGFDTHQTGLHKRTESRFPGNSRKFPEIPGDSRTTELNRTEEKGREENRATARHRHAPGPLAGSLHRDHIDHGFCGQRFCVKTKHILDFERQYGEGGPAAVQAWLQTLHDGLGAHESPGGPLWVIQQFESFLEASGRLKRPSQTKPPAAGTWAATKAELRAKAGLA